MPAGGIIAAGAIGGAATLATGYMASKDQKKALKAMQGQVDAAVAELEKIGVPPDLSKEIIYKQFQQQGVMTPELEQAIEISHSKLGEMQERAPELRDQQMQALQLIQQRGRTGLAPEDRAALNQVRQQVQRDAEAKRQQILQNFAARGQGGSGNELIASLQAGQGGADQASAEGDRIAAQASMNALAAMSQGGQLAGQMRQQDYSVDSSKASALDELAKFNTQNSVGRQTRNVGAKNEAQASNLATQQRISEMNTQQANAEKLRQQEAIRQQWLDKLAKAQAIAGARTGSMQQAIGAGQMAGSNAMWGGISNAIGQGASAYGKYAASQPSGGTTAKPTAADQARADNSQANYDYYTKK